LTFSRREPKLKDLKEPEPKRTGARTKRSCGIVKKQVKQKMADMILLGNKHPI
jgi:hypothetical protein